MNKEYKGAECVLEYAICKPCREQFTNRIPEESKKSVRGFLEREIDWDQRLKDSMLSYDSAERVAA